MSVFCFVCARFPSLENVFSFNLLCLFFSDSLLTCLEHVIDAYNVFEEVMRSLSAANDLAAGFPFVLKKPAPSCFCDHSFS